MRGNEAHEKYVPRHQSGRRGFPRFSREILIAAGVVGCLGIAVGTAVTMSGGTGPDPAYTTLSADRKDAAEAVNRSLPRSEAATPTGSPSATPTPTPSLSPKPAVKTNPAPVAGLTRTQMKNAAIIVEVARAMGMPRQAMIIAVATGLQESNLYNNASEAVPESLQYPHEGTSVDHDSVGVFQQRTSAGWGSVKDLMNPRYQARNFFTKLKQIDWRGMELWEAAQAVQISAFPYAYAKHEARATTIVGAFF